MERHASETYLCYFAAQFFFGQSMITLVRNQFHLQLFELLSVVHVTFCLAENAHDYLSQLGCFTFHKSTAH